MDDDERKKVLADAGKAVESVLPPGDGPRGKSPFVLLVFTDPTDVQLLSTCSRVDTISAMVWAADSLDGQDDAPG